MDPRTNRLLAWILVAVAIITVNVIVFDMMAFYLFLKIGQAASEGTLSGN